MARDAFRAHHASHHDLSPAMPIHIPNWRCFQTISSDAEASSFSESCLFSLATLEVDCDPATNSFALTEQELPDVWRWAIISERGVILHAGCEATQAAAKKFATAALLDGSTAA